MSVDATRGRGASIMVLASVVLMGAAVLLLLSRDGALALRVDVDVFAAAVAVLATAAGIYALLRSPPEWSRMWWPAAITLMAALVTVMALVMRFALAQQWDDQVMVAGEAREVRLFAPRGEGPYPGLVLVGRPDRAEAAYLGRYLSERGLVVLYSPTASAEDMQAQAAQAAVELTWLTEQRRVDADRSGFLGAGEAAGLAAAVAPEAGFVVTVLDEGAAHPGIWQEVRIPILALVGGVGAEGAPSAERLVDELIDVVAPEALNTLDWLIFDDSDRRLREPGRLGLSGPPQGYPLVVPVWIHNLGDAPPPDTMPLPWMPQPEAEEAR